MTEFELKFQVPPERAAAVESALLRGAVERTHLRARYFDSADQALARAGLVLRLRQEGRRWVQTAKGPGAGGFDRLEHEVPVPGGATAQPDPGRHAGHPVHAPLVRALEAAEGPLLPVFETDVMRVARSVLAGGTKVEIAFDRGEVRGGGRSHPVLEIEFELKQGSRAGLLELAQAWCDTHGLWLDPLSKSGLGRRLALGVTEPPATRWTAPLEGGKGWLPAVFDAALLQVLGNARELAAGTGGDAHVHQLRVGLRRVRTALRELQPLAAWPPPPADLEQALHDLFGVLGTHRDRATLLPGLLADLAARGSPMREWRPALPDVGAAVRGADVQAMLLRLVALAQQLRQERTVGAKSARQLVRDRLQHLHRKALRAGRHFEALPPAERHRVRKQLKRLRYLAEMARPLYRGDAVDGYVEALGDLQDALGLYQDAAAAGALLAERAKEDPGAWFGAGWLAAREQALAAECEKACRRTAGRARPFWD
jgi:inorganic triphosphatase YgiF